MLAATGCFLVPPEAEFEEVPVRDESAPGDGEPVDKCRAVTTLLDPGEPGRARLEDQRFDTEVRDVVATTRKALGD